MKIKKLNIKNFRLLEDIKDFELDTNHTIIVGRNNSGKTSLTELFKKFMNEGVSFQFEDFPLSSYKELRESVTLYGDFKNEKDDEGREIKEKLFLKKTPEISLQATLIFDGSDNLSILPGIDLDEDPNNNKYKIILKYILKNKIQFYERALLSETDFIEFLKKNFEGSFEVRIFFIDSLGNEQPYDGKIKDIFKVDFIDAQRHLDDNSSDKNKTLSKIFETYFKKNNPDKKEDIETALIKVNGDLDAEYGKFFGLLHTALKDFGYPGLGEKDKKLILKSELEAREILKGNNAKIYYSQDSGNLPESYNGLGYSNLIYIILQLLYLYGEFDKLEPKPQFQVLFIEEPEAHLHPQMQQTFIKQIEKFVQSKGWNIQIIITTHSSHIISSSDFSKIRYFHKKETGGTEVKDFQSFKDSDNEKFIQKYLTLEKSDMFFADKLIMIEGMVERILLPLFIQRTDVGITNEKEKLSTQYISTIEVGGAYAHKFEKFLKFLGIKTLIITDLDSVADDGKKCKVSDGVKTSNSSLKSWIPGKEDVSELLLLSDEGKVKDNFRVVYQVQENGKTGRSFEDAFILANANELANFSNAGFEILKSQFENLNKDQIIENGYWDVAEYIDKNSKKTDFAFDIMMMDNFIVPKYIREGLIWLSKD